jgi:pimeloyl-ACP methyl ester carboxylesterase
VALEHAHGLPVPLLPAHSTGRLASRLARFLFWVLTAAFAAAAVHLVQAAIIQNLEEQAIEPKAAGTATPGQFGVAFRDIRVPVADHVMHGRFVQAASPAAPAVLIFHGNGEDVSDWSAVQARLFESGVSSLVFDYSGFGSSSGKPTVKRMREDAYAAYAKLVLLAPGSVGHVLIGHSLGNAVMLDVASTLQPVPSGIVIHAGFTSAREMAIQSGLVSALVAKILPDLWDNERALAGSGPPLLVLHGERDDVIPLAMGRRLAQAAGARADFQALAGIGHDDFYASPSKQEWDPIVGFVASISGSHQLEVARR